MHIAEHIRLRPATELDTSFAREIHHRALRDVVVTQFGPWDEELQNGFFRQSGFPTGFEIIEYDGKACGYIRTEDVEAGTEVHNLYIDPRFQRRGIGTFLLERVIALGQPVGLQVLFENTKAADLYRRLGFEMIGRTDTHFKMRLSQ